MTDNKRAADDAEREAVNRWSIEQKVFLTPDQWDALWIALSSRADGGKGEAVAKALDHCDWSGAPIGNKVIIQQAIDVLSGKPSMTNGSFHCPACGEVMKGPTHCGHCLWDADTCGYAYTAPQAECAPREAQPELQWAVSRWEAEVKNRPLVNVHRRTLDETWRQVIRHFGGEPTGLVGPSHAELIAREKQ
jgi:hypothetical protein